MYDFLIEMDHETKMKLLKWTDSYWDMLPPELKEIILKYKESQELRQSWQVGHIQCRPIHRDLGVKCECMRVYGWYRDLRGRIHKTYLGISLNHAMTNCDIRRVRYRDEEWMLIGVPVGN